MRADANELRRILRAYPLAVAEALDPWEVVDYIDESTGHPERTIRTRTHIEMANLLVALIEASP
jgi:hypothetical protein